MSYDLICPLPGKESFQISIFDSIPSEQNKMPPLFIFYNNFNFFFEIIVFEWSYLKILQDDPSLSPFFFFFFNTSFLIKKMFIDNANLLASKIKHNN